MSATVISGFLSDAVKLTKIKDHSTAATSEVSSDSVDMLGYDGALFFSSFGTADATNSLKLQQSSDDASTDAYSDLEGTSVASGTSDEDVWIDITQPGKRYLKLIATRGASSTLESMWVIQYKARALPVDNTTSGTIVGEQFNGPAEGTA